MRGVFLLLLALLIAVPARASDVAAAARSVVRVAVVVETPDGAYLAGHGSGFAVAPNLVVTNAHVVEAGGQPNVQIAVVPSQGSDPLPARILDYAPDVDMAVLQLDRDALPAATLFAGAVPDNAPVAAIGYPGALDDAFQRGADDQIRPMAPEATRGWISSQRPNSPYGANVPGFTHTAPIGRGSSGGPLVDDCGRVIGVNSAQSLGEEGDAEFAFATAVPVLTTYLGRLGLAAQTTRAPCLGEAERTRAALEASERRAAEAERQAAAAREAATAAQARLEARLRAEARMGEQRLLLSLLLGGLALAATVVAVLRAQQRDLGWAAAAAVVAAAALAGAVIVNLNAATPLEQTGPAGAAAAVPTESAAPAGLAAGDIRCRLKPEDSRITLSDATDAVFSFDGDACVDGRMVYARSGTRLTRALIATHDRSLTRVTIDLASGRMTRDHYLLGSAAFDQAVAAVASQGVLACGSDGPARAAAVNQALAPLFAARPDQHIVWQCASAG